MTGGEANPETLAFWWVHPKEGYGGREKAVSVSIMAGAITTEQNHKLND